MPVATQSTQTPKLFEDWMEDVEELWQSDVFPAFRSRLQSRQGRKDADGYAGDEDLHIPCADWGDWDEFHAEGKTPREGILAILEENGNEDDAEQLRAKWQENGTLPA